MSVIRCPSCDRSINAPPAFLGKKVKCPGCQKPFLAKLADTGPPGPPDPPKAKENDDSDEYRLARFSDPPVDPFISKDPFSGQSLDNLSENVSSTPYVQTEPISAIDLPESRSYPALNMIRIFLRIIAALLLIAAVIVLLVGLIAAFAMNRGSALIPILSAFGICLVNSILILAFSEIIRVILDIQSNTLAAARK